MRYISRFFMVLIGGMLLVNLVSAVVVSEWRYHFFHLLNRSWGALMAASSSSTFGLLYYSVGGALLIFLITVLRKHYGSDKKDWGIALQESLPELIIGFAVIPTLAALAFGNFIVRTAYRDHQDLVSIDKALMAAQAHHLPDDRKD